MAKTNNQTTVHKILKKIITHSICMLQEVFNDTNESVNRRNDTIIGITDNGQTMTSLTLDRKLEIDQHQPL